MRVAVALCAAAAVSATGAASDWFRTGDAEAGRAVFEARCPACHGVAGESALGPDNPYLAGQSGGYLAKQLSDYKTGARKDPVMGAMLAAVDESDLVSLAAFLSSQPPWTGADGATDDPTGREIHAGGLPDRGIPACAACHGAGAMGIPQEFPRLAGQVPTYLAGQLRRFRSGERHNEIMNAVAKQMTDAEIEAVAAHLSGL